MRTIALALLALATPALAQTGPEVRTDKAEVAAPPVDAALVGEWTLERVVAPGVMGTYGVTIQAMTCRFSADGQAHVSMAAVQDGDTMSRQRAFAFETEGQEIVEDSGARVAYRVTEDGLLELTDDEMVILFARAR